MSCQNKKSFTYNMELFYCSFCNLALLSLHTSALPQGQTKWGHESVLCTYKHPFLHSQGLCTECFTREMCLRKNEVLCLLSPSHLHWISHCLVNPAFVTDTVRAYRFIAVLIKGEKKHYFGVLRPAECQFIYNQQVENHLRFVFFLPVFNLSS